MLTVAAFCADLVSRPVVLVAFGLSSRDCLTFAHVMLLTLVHAMDASHRQNG